MTFSETRLLLPFSSSGAIHGSVPLTPPDTRVLRLILDNPKSPTCRTTASGDAWILTVQVQKYKTEEAVDRSFSTEVSLKLQSDYNFSPNTGPMFFRELIYA